MIPEALRDSWTLILCGGKGTRAYPHTLDVPKPLMDVAGRPILRHVMDIYAHQGARRFLLAGGYKIDMIRAKARGETAPAGAVFSVSAPFWGRQSRQEGL